MYRYYQERLYVCCSGCDGTVRLWLLTPLTSGTPLYVCCSGCDGTVRLWSVTPLTSGTLCTSAVAAVTARSGCGYSLR